MGESDCKIWPTGDTDGYDTDAAGYITCPSNRACDIDQAFWDEISQDPLGLSRDKTYGVFSSSGSTLKSVFADSIAWQLQLRTDDLITAVDGMPVTSFEDVEAAIDALQDETSWTVTVIRDGRSLTFIYTIA